MVLVYPCAAAAVECCIGLSSVRLLYCVCWMLLFFQKCDVFLPESSSVGVIRSTEEWCATILARPLHAFAATAVAAAKLEQPFLVVLSVCIHV